MSEQEEKRQRRFHEQLTILTLDLDRAYLDAGRVLNATHMENKDTKKLLAGWMEALSQMSTMAHKIRNEEEDEL